MKTHTITVGELTAYFLRYPPDKEVRGLVLNDFGTHKFPITGLHVLEGTPDPVMYIEVGRSIPLGKELRRIKEAKDKAEKGGYS